MKALLSRIVFMSALAMVCGPSLVPVAKAQNPSTREKASAMVTDKAAEKTAPSPQPPVASTAPVITIHGLCKNQAGAHGEASSCDTAITRQGFETLLNAVNFGGETVRPDARRSFAQTYADLLLFENAADKAGLANTEQYRQILRWLTLRTIADIYYHNQQEKYRVPTQSEIDAYYKEHLSSFETVRLARILIPKDNYTVRDKEGFAKKAEEAANQAHERAARGESPDQIQKDAYAALGIPGGTPPTDLGNKRRSELLASEADELFQLAPGQVSQIEKEPASFVIYKVVSKETPHEDQVKAEISKKLSEENWKTAIQAVRDSAKVDFNPQYFGSANPAPPKSTATISPASARH